jgi:hypothetical protein
LSLRRSSPAASARTLHVAMVSHPVEVLQLIKTAAEAVSDAT